MRKKMIVNFTILNLFFVFAYSLKFGEICVRNPDECENSLNLQCTEVSPGRFICQCDNFSFLSPTNSTKCLKYRDIPGEECELQTDQCKNIEGAACDDEFGSSKCLCQERFGYFEFPLGVKCAKFSLNLNDDCQNGEGSKFCERIEGSHCALLEGNSNTKCVCDEIGGYFEHPNRNNCVKFAEDLNDFCEPSAIRVCERLSNTICSNKDGISYRCICDSEFYEDVQEKLCQELPALPSEKCLLDEHCRNIPNSNCLCVGENCTCECSPNFDTNLEGDICLARTKFVGEICESDIQCLNLDDTVCITVSDGRKRCLCTGNGDFVPSFSRLSCLPIVNNTGDYCEDGVQCEVILGSLSTCIDNTCDCINGSVPNSFLDQCLPFRFINETCSESPQCTESLGPESMCEETCQCKQGAGFLNERCFKKIPLNAICINPAECILYSGNYSSCVDQTCQCISSAVQYNNICYPYKEVGEACNNSEECFATIPGGAICDGGKCICEYPSIPSANNTICSSAQKVFECFAVFLIGTAFLFLLTF